MPFNELNDSESVPSPRMNPCTDPGGHSLPSEVRIALERAQDIVDARRRAREMASRIGFSRCDATLIATAISEVARNAVEYANGGEIVLTSIEEGMKKGLKIVVEDSGPGIADVPTVMRDGYSTGNGLGIGLPGARRLVDAFEVRSELGSGTTVIMKKWVDV